MPKRGLELSKTQINAYCKKHNFPNPLLDAGLQDSKPKQDAEKPLGGKTKRQGTGDGRIIVRLCSYRVKPLDLDNAYGGGKNLLDCVKEIHLIPDDNPEEIRLIVDQKRVEHYNQEKTLLEITYPE